MLSSLLWLVLWCIWLWCWWFRPSNDDDDDDGGPGYLIFLPYQGAANQLTCLVRAVMLAELTGRILVIPDIHPSKHDGPEAQTRPFNSVIHLSLLLGQVKQVDAAQFFQSNYLITCISYGRWHSIEDLGRPAQDYVAMHKLNGLYLDWQGDWPHPPTLSHILPRLAGQHMACIANLQHIHFGNLDTILTRIAFRHHTTRHSPRVAVHWRRGDFATACRNKNMTACWPTEQQLVSRLSKIKDDCDDDEDIAIYSNDPSDLPRQLRHLYVPSGCVFADMADMIDAGHFIGNRYSTISRIVRSLREARNRSVEFF